MKFHEGLNEICWLKYFKYFSEHLERLFKITIINVKVIKQNFSRL